MYRSPALLGDCSRNCHDLGTHHKAMVLFHKYFATHFGIWKEFGWWLPMIIDKHRSKIT